MKKYNYNDQKRIDQFIASKIERIEQLFKIECSERIIFMFDEAKVETNQPG